MVLFYSSEFIFPWAGLLSCVLTLTDFSTSFRADSVGLVFFFFFWWLGSRVTLHRARQCRGVQLCTWYRCGHSGRPCRNSGSPPERCKGDISPAMQVCQNKQFHSQTSLAGLLYRTVQELKQEPWDSPLTYGYCWGSGHKCCSIWHGQQKVESHEKLALVRIKLFRMAHEQYKLCISIAHAYQPHLSMPYVLLDCTCSRQDG